ncbi:chemotaxis protein CheB [Methanosarcina sp.]|uniref:chemotaxis protein CheB n=1 Tax=Methanosarcina sp. TaxID=2213 RepID=UPI002AB9C3CD|nr:chemotaxis protein CheB [Methanosarcina sp.]MDY9927173.1 CheR family methyltransferase [Methanosarcina sp.]
MVEKVAKIKEKIGRSKEEQLHTSEENPVINPRAMDTDSNKSLTSDFPIVGIGASAGGLAAFENFFSAISDDTHPGAAFVIVQHLDPSHKSILTDLIGRYTHMPVYEVKDGMVVQPNCIYVIPPNYDMMLEYGTLQLQKRTETGGLHLPVNLFFRSLALNKQELSIGIILSGTGEDGTLGARAIKDAGGMVIVQSPESSEYDGMPRSAIATGLADYILPPAEMPAQLIAYVNQVFGKRPHVVPKAENAMKSIFNLIRAKAGHDFSDYKLNTISRRIERRMAIINVNSLDEYVLYLQQKPDEVDALFQDLLIGVTSFFRNPTAFEALKETVIPNLFTGKHPDSTIRIWVPGCSTGEEAYSIAILLKEQMEILKKNFKVQIFATDIDSRAILKARSGVYPSTISIDLSPERLERFFIQDSNGNYRIQKNIRDMIVFSEHDIIKDPPFSKLALLSCRNVLIYMEKKLQKKLIPLFHYALDKDGFLFLGPSETLGEFENLFETLDRKSKLYRKKDVSSGPLLIGTFIPSRLENGETKKPSSKAPIESKPQLRELTEQTMLQHYTSVGVLVDKRGDILYIHGRTGMYLELASGEAGPNNILKTAREGLKQELATALHIAVVRKEPVFRSELRVKTNGDFTTVNLALRPVAAGSDEADGQNLFLVIIEEAKTSEQSQIEKDIAIGDSEGACEKSMDVDACILELKRELQIKEESLKASNEELETSNEELKASNEEMQSINEELQSTNEELETSREELQSVNEELTTVNTELQNKVADLSQAVDDMNNLLAGTGIGTIFVDHQMHILRFTPQVTSVVNLIPTDVGRPVGHIVSNLLGYDRLVEDIKEVLDTLAPKDIEVQTKKSVWYLLRIRPYRTIENVIRGAVITFTDINEIKRAEDIMKEAKAIRRLAAVVQDAKDAIIMQDLEGHITAWNQGAERIYGWSEAEALTMNISSLIPESHKEKELATLKKLNNAAVLEPYRTQRLAKDGRIVEVWLTATSLVNEAGEVYAIATTELEINSGNKKKEGHD